MYTDSVQSTGNTAEVAVFISSPSVLAIADGGKRILPKDLPWAKGALPGTVQNMHGTVIGKMLCCLVITSRFALCPAQGFHIAPLLGELSAKLTEG